MTNGARRRSLFLALAAGALGTACNDTTVYAFSGQKFDTTNQCLLPESVIDVIRGTATGTCTGVRCFVGADGSVYVSGQCVAPPTYVDHSNDMTDATCQAALHAYSLGASGACPAAG